MTIHTKTSRILCMVIPFLMFLSCAQQAAKVAETPTIENTLKSLSIFQDSTSIASSDLRASFQKINVAIDSIGYPDAGYQIWERDNKDSTGFTIIIEGSWPDQETYDAIHGHELYKKAMDAETTNWAGINRTQYYRVTKVK